MQGQDQCGVLGDTQILRRDLDPLSHEPVDFLEQCVGIDHHAIAYDGKLPLSHDTRRQQRQLVRDPFDNERMASIMSPLEADDDVGLLGQPVDDFPLPFVPPLGTDHDHIGHEAPSIPAADAPAYGP